MKKEFTLSEILEIERQLACPSGLYAVDLGKNMHESNIGMTLSGIRALEICDENKVLELGHGNCRHLMEILGAAKKVTYHGLEISDAMYKEAVRFADILGEEANFSLYDGQLIPYADESFDRILTVNTIYFWRRTQSFLNEIARVLKPGGIFALVFAEKKFMKKLPFVGERFKLYNDGELEKLIASSDLRIKTTDLKTEKVRNKLGEQVNRAYHTIQLCKK